MQDLSKLEPTVIRNGAADQKVRDILNRHRIKAESAETPPGGSDDGAPKPKPAKPPPTREQRDAQLTRAKERLAEKSAEVEARHASIKSEREQQRRMLAEAAELERLRRDNPAEFVRRFTGKGVRPLLESVVAEDRETPAEKEAKRLQRQTKALEEKLEGMERKARGTQTLAAVAHECRSFMQHSDVLREADPAKVTELVVQALAKGGYSTPRAALRDLAEQVAAELAEEEPKPAPKLASKPPAPVVAKKKPKKQPDTNAARAFVARFRKYQGR